MELYVFGKLFGWIDKNIVLYVFDKLLQWIDKNL